MGVQAALGKIRGERRRVVEHRLAERIVRHGNVGQRRRMRDADAERFAERLLGSETFGKALGIGVAHPATLPNIAVTHDELGKPMFDYGPELASYLAERGLRAHLSISDEAEYAVAFVVIERE